MRPWYALLPLVSLLLLASLPSVAVAEPGPTLRARVDGIAKPYVEKGALQGMVVGVLDLGKDERLVAGYGAGDPDGRTVYEIGSISKVFTGVLLASMVADGSVRLDQPAEELAGGETIPADDGKKITLVHLSTHTSGLPRMPNNFAPADLTDPYADYTPALMFAFLKDYQLTRAPGDQYEYSNLGAGLLGYLLARKAGVSYEELLAARITGPLGMKDTVVALTPELKKRVAKGHDASGNPVANWNIPLAGAGGIRSTVDDMLRFLRANLVLDDAKLAAVLAEARRVHYTPPQAGAHRLGLGWHISPKGAHWHNGQTGGYHSYAVVDTKRRVAVVVLSNTASGDVDQLGEEIYLTLIGALKPEKTVKPEILASYAGSYRVAPNFKLTVTVEKGRLMVQATNQPKIPVYAESDTKFFYKVVDAQITFVKDATGKVTGLVVHQNGMDHPAEKE